jgi:hypothetical protein
MLNLNYKTVEADTEPVDIDLTSSPTTVYINKNAHQEEKTDIVTGETRIVWIYDQAQVNRQEYDNYMQGKTQADIEYLYMMTGVDYDE